MTADEVATPTEIERAAAPQAMAPPSAKVASPKFPATCDAIARDIEKIARQFAQLANYRAVDQKDCVIRYAHAVGRPRGRGGWAAATPHPEPHGIWLYIGIYDPNGPDATLQIHTQPGTPPWWIGSRRVMFLIKEGERTTKAAGAIRKILEKHGLEER